MNRLIEGLKKLYQTGFVHIFGTGVLNKVITFASSLLLVRIIEKSTYGVFSYAESLINVLVVFAGLGLNSGYLQIGSEHAEEGERNNYFLFACRYGTIYNVLFCTFIFLAALVIPLKIKGSNAYLMMMSGLPVLQFLSFMQESNLRSRFDNQKYAYYSLFVCISTLVFANTFSYFGQATGLVIAKYTVYLLAVLFGIFYCKVPISFRKDQLSKTQRKDILKIGGISMLNNGISALLYQLDILVLGVFVIESGVIASYKIATQIPNALAFIPSTLVVYIYPYFARNKDNKQWLFQNYKKVLLGMGCVNLCIVICLLGSARFLIPLVFGERYSDAIGPFIVLTIAYFFSGTFRTIAGNLLVTQRKLKFNLCVAILSGILNIILNVIFINRWGSIGAAFATLAVVLFASILNTTYLIYTFSKIGKPCISE